jgi:hypothetical protein
VGSFGMQSEDFSGNSGIDRTHPEPGFQSSQHPDLQGLLFEAGYRPTLNFPLSAEQASAAWMQQFSSQGFCQAVKASIFP